MCSEYISVRNMKMWPPQNGFHCENPWTNTHTHTHGVWRAIASTASGKAESLNRWWHSYGRFHTMNRSAIYPNRKRFIFTCIFSRRNIFSCDLLKSTKSLSCTSVRVSRAICWNFLHPKVQRGPTQDSQTGTWRMLMHYFRFVLFIYFFCITMCSTRPS